MCFFRRQKNSELVESDEEDVDELSLIDHKEIMSRITLKQEVRRPFLRRVLRQNRTAVLARTVGLTAWLGVKVAASESAVKSDWELHYCPLVLHL